MPLYAIPDIHGHKDKLDQALTRITADGGEDAEVIFLGDLVDRGPDSRGVIQTLMDGMAAGRKWTVLRGNHDQLFLDFLDHGHVIHPRLRAPLTWLHDRMGGARTLASYGVTASEEMPNRDATLEAVPQAHRDWLASLPFYHKTPDYLFVHAGILPRAPLEWQATDDMTWIRDEFLSYTKPHPWLVVHGHTVIDYPCHYGNRINLDGGAGKGRYLHAARLDGQDCTLLTEAGPVPLTPDG